MLLTASTLSSAALLFLFLFFTTQAGGGAASDRRLQACHLPLHFFLFLFFFFSFFSLHRLVAGQLATGDCKHAILRCKHVEGAFAVDGGAYVN
jgi:hypothetical protein